MTGLLDRLVEAALPHVPFDGWSPDTFRRAVEDAEVSPAQARTACPRGALDLAVAFHRRDDMAMVARVKAEDLSAMRYRDRVAHAVRTRLEIADANKEAVRRGIALFSLPPYAAEGTRALWGTADAVWTALGDTSDDVNWYTKRATLAGVYGSTVLYWLGDQSDGCQETWGFLDRRIDGVMAIEKAKGRLRSSPLWNRTMAGPMGSLLSRIRAPSRVPPSDLPGMWGPTPPASGGSPSR